MGLIDKAKDLLGDNKEKVKDGIDTAADAVADKAGDHADKVEKAAEVAKDAVDKLPD